MFVGDKVMIEEVDPSSLELFREWRNDPEIRQYLRAYTDITVDMQNEWYSAIGNNSNPNEIYFQISTKSEDAQDDMSKLIGCCALTHIDWRIRSAEFSIFLGRERGKGNGRDALQLMFNYGFKELNLHKIWCEVFSNNGAIHLYRKMGFEDEGILRDNYFIDGEYMDSLILSVLESEWGG